MEIAAEYEITYMEASALKDMFNVDEVFNILTLQIIDIQDQKNNKKIDTNSTANNLTINKE